MASIKKKAFELQDMGRRGDTLLAHINPREAAMLKRAGGSGTRNPKTGLLEFEESDSDGTGSGNLAGGTEASASDVGANFGSDGSGDGTGSGAQLGGGSQSGGAGNTSGATGGTGGGDFSGGGNFSGYGDYAFTGQGLAPEGQRTGLTEAQSQQALKNFDAQRAGQTVSAADLMASGAKGSGMTSAMMDMGISKVGGVLGMLGQGLSKGLTGNSLGGNLAGLFGGQQSAMTGPNLVGGSGIGVGQGISGNFNNQTGAFGMGGSSNSGSNFGGTDGGGNGNMWEAALQGVNAAQQYSDANKATAPASSSSTSMGGTDLNSLFGPNSSAYIQLRKELEARDAAGGRRSQYGPREVELQAKMAGMMANSAPGIMNANTSANRLAWEQSTAGKLAKQQSLNSMYGIGKGVLDSGALSGLGSMFSGSSPGYTSSPSSNYVDQYSQGGPSMGTYGTVGGGEDDWLSAWSDLGF